MFPPAPSPSILRPARAGDAQALAALGRESFCAAFAHLYDPRDLGAFLEQVYAQAIVAQEIADPAILHRLAESGDRLTGFCKLKLTGDYGAFSAAKRPLVLAQLYTDPDRTGEGIGAALLQWALAEAQARGCDAVQLSVWSENKGAQKFYERHGFAKIADIDFWVGNHRDDEFLYELRLG